MNGDRMRVTFVIDDLGYGGAQRQLYHLANALRQSADLDVIVISEQVEPYLGRLRGLGVDVSVIPRRAPLEMARARALIACLRARQAGIVHAMLEASNTYAFVAARTLRRPLVVSLRDSRLLFTGARLMALRWIYRHADAVTVNSLAGREHLLHVVGVPAGRVHLVPNIVPLSDSLPRPDPAPGPLLGCIGRLSEQKRFHAVIEAMPAVRRVFPGARLEIIGEGPLREHLEATARRVGADAYTEFTGPVDDPAPRMARFACLVIASGHEGVPNVALEAMAIGLPVVAVAIGDLAQVVHHGVTGTIAHDGSAESLAQAIIATLSSGELAASAAREGPRLVREQFSEAAARERSLEVYRRVWVRP